MPEFLRQSFERLQAAWARLRANIAQVGGIADGRNPVARALPWIGLFIVFMLVVYYPIGMLIYDDVDDDLAVVPAPEYAIPGGSHAVALAATLTDREADRWLPNRPFWHPSAFLDNTPNYQLGVIYAVSRFAIELGDYLGRVRGSSAIDPNLDRAAGLLKYDGRTWYWGQGNIIPTAKADSQYRKAVEALVLYNRDLAEGRAIYERRADNLIAFLDRVAADLGSASAVLDASVASGGGHFDSDADDVFYNVKGKLYGYAVLLTALGEDFAVVIKEKQASEVWNNMLTSLRTGATMDPLIVINGAQDSSLTPSHLATLGFHLLRARTQIRELADTLQK